VKKSTGAFIWTTREFYGSTIALWFPKTINLEDKFLMKYTSPNFLFIPVAPRCTRIFDRIIGGPE